MGRGRNRAGGGRCLHRCVWRFDDRCHPVAVRDGRSRATACRTDASPFALPHTRSRIVVTAAAALVLALCDTRAPDLFLCPVPAHPVFRLPFAPPRRQAAVANDQDIYTDSTGVPSFSE